MNKGDIYGSVFRERCKRIMGEPAGFRPLNVRRPSLWQRYGEDIKMVSAMVALTLVAAVLWVALNEVERWFR